MSGNLDAWRDASPQFASWDRPVDHLEDHGISRPRQRASIACIECRMRKTKCDVYKKGNPCSNCVLNKRTCIIKRRLRKGQSDTSKIDAQSASLLCFDSFDCSHVAPSLPAFPVHATLENDTFVPSVIPGSPPPENSLPTRPDQADLNGWDWGAPALRNPITEKRSPPDQNDYHADGSPFKQFEHTTRQPQDLQLVVKPEVHYSYYSFLNPGNLTRLPPEDLLFLQNRRCFSVPSSSDLEQLVTRYFQRVHPQLPLLDERAFFIMYRDHKSSTQNDPKMSLFVFQSLLHVACSFLTASEVRRLGFESIRQARLSYYRRAKAMFDLGIEGDSLTVAQGALLLTYYTPFEDPKAHSFWLGVAIQHSSFLHAHDHKIRLSSPSSHTTQLKRLWWCCFVRDRSLSLGLRRPLQISKVTADMMPPSLSEEDCAAEISESEFYTSSTKRSMLQAFNRLCQLSVCLSTAMELMYPTSEASPLRLQMRIPFEESKRRLLDAERELDIWHEEARQAEVATSITSQSEISLLVLQKLAHMYYFAAKASLHSKVILDSILDTSIARNAVACRSDSTKKLEQAINGITLILIDLLQAKAVSHLPVAAVALASLPLAWHVTGSTLTPKPRNSSALEERVRIYKKMMLICQVMYEGTDRVIDTITESIQRIEMEDRASNTLHGPTKNWNAKSQCANPWSKILLLQPQSYSRVILGLDISLSLGRKLCRDDLPPALQPPADIDVAHILTRRLPMPDATCNSNMQQKNKLDGSEHCNGTSGLATCNTANNEHFLSLELADEKSIRMGSIQQECSTKNAAGPYHPAETEFFQKLLQGYAEAGQFGLIDA